MKNCSLCPRKCGINRLDGEKGFCGAGKNAEVHTYMEHHGEEPPVSGKFGSGTIFFSHCTMKCCYCQNYKFSQEDNGTEASTDRLAGMMRELESRGCHNINLVTPTHYMPQIVEAIDKAGLKIPIVYNTSGYERVEILKLLNGVVDIYLTDMRYGDNRAAGEFSQSHDYVENNQAAVKEMYRQVGNVVIEDGVAKKGLIVRHLVLPDNRSGSRAVLKFLAGEISKDVSISLMSQYFPAYKANEHPGISRRITPGEYAGAVKAMEDLGLSSGWVQTEWSQETLARYAGVNFRRMKNA